MCGIPCIFVYDSNNHTNTCTIHFFIKPTNKKVNCARVGVIIAVNNKLVYSLNNIKFLGIFINDKLSSACYTVRVMKQYMPLKTLIMIFYAYFHSLMNYGLIFWGNSPYSIHIFRLQKKGNKNHYI
jgi:hypothetical protein